MTSYWKACCTRIPQRWVFAVMGCLAIMNAYTMRICLSLTITAMVAPRGKLTNGTKSDTTCPTPESTSSGSHSSGTFEWDEYTQGLILSSFYLGYIVTPIPGGVLATKFGGKYVLGLGILSTAIFTLLTPTVVKSYDAAGLIVFRILMGFCEGTTFPAMTTLVAQWAPPHERSKINAVVLTGAQVGSVAANVLSGVLTQRSSTGWAMAFYVFGTFGVLWFSAWVFLCYSYPDVHPFISEKEKKYLRETMREHTHKNVQPIPWLHMFTSVPIWALLAGKFGREFGFYVILSDLPKYMSDVLKFSVEANGLLTSLPHIAMWIVGIGSSCLADWLIKTDKLSRKYTRKIFTTLAALGSGVFIVAASYAGCNHTVAVIFFTVGMAMTGFSYPGIMSNTLDLCPNYSGTLMAISSIITSLCGMMAPYMIGVLTPNQALLEWRTAFWITFLIFCVTTLIFNYWSDSEVQYWNDLSSWVEKQKKLNDEERASFLDISTKPDETGTQHRS